MMSLETMREVSREKAAAAAAENRQPYIVRAGDVDDWLAGRGYPLPFPEIGDYVPEGWQHVRTLFCDHSGFGRDDEPALSIEQMLRELQIDHGYAITEVGQFQLRLGEYKPPRFGCGDGHYAFDPADFDDDDVREEPATYDIEAPSDGVMSESMLTAIIELIDHAETGLRNIAVRKGEEIDQCLIRQSDVSDRCELLRREIFALHTDMLEKQVTRLCFDVAKAKGFIPADAPDTDTFFEKYNVRATAAGIGKIIDDDQVSEPDAPAYRVEAVGPTAQLIVTQVGADAFDLLAALTLVAGEPTEIYRLASGTKAEVSQAMAERMALLTNDGERIEVGDIGGVHRVSEPDAPLYVRKASGRYRVAEPAEVLHTAALMVRPEVGDAIRSPDDTERFLRLKLAHLPHEIFACIFLDNRHRVIDYQEIFRGTIDGTAVYPREIVKEALSRNAAAIILAHNHPSGIPEPSQADERITKRLKSACELIDVRVLDHVIIGADKSVSLASRGVI